MRGLGAYQLAQMKHRDARVFELCRHLRSAIDILESMASAPLREEESRPTQPSASPPPPAKELPPEKLAYTLKEAAAALGVGKTTIYRALKEGQLKAIKFGSRTLLPASALRAWIASLPAATF